jgi:hypothetical protein
VTAVSSARMVVCSSGVVGSRVPVPVIWSNSRRRGRPRTWLPGRSHGRPRAANRSRIMVRIAAPEAIRTWRNSGRWVASRASPWRATWR